MGGVVGGAELLGERAGEGLHLVATGEEGELLEVGGTQVGRAVGEELEGLIPGDDLEVQVPRSAPAAAAGAGSAAPRVLLHDRGALGADDALVQGVVGVALDVAHLAVTGGSRMPQRQAHM